MARKAGIASFIGTTIEWYDFYIYGTAAALVFGQVFFSDELSSGVATLLAFVTLWAGFLARPLGGVIFGHLGDRLGRKNTLVITLVMMGIATVGIGLLPTYAQIGMWAPVLLVFLRIVQGVAVGGEWGGAVLIASENAPKGKGILYSAFAQQGSPAGNLLSTMAFFFLAALPTPQFMMWGWRIPFLLSGVLVVIGMVIRLELEESDAMKAVLARKKTVKLPIKEVLRKHWVLVLLGAGALPLAQVTYFKNTFALSWATSELGYERGTFLAIIAIALVVQFIVQPFGAVLVSKIDMRRAMLLMIVPELFLMPAMFYAIRTETFAIAVIGMCLATIPHSMFYGAIAGILTRAFPANIRYSGLSLAYQLCSLIVGGGTPVLAQYLLNSSGDVTGVAIAAACYAAVSLVCTLALLERTGYDPKAPSVAEKSDERLGMICERNEHDLGVDDVRCDRRDRHRTSHPGRDQGDQRQRIRGALNDSGRESDVVGDTEQQLAQHRSGFGGQHHPRLVREVLEPDLLTVGERVLLGQRHDEVLSGHDARRDARWEEQQAHDADVELARGQLVERLARVRRTVEHEFDTGMSAPHELRPPAHEIVRGRTGETDTDPAGLTRPRGGHRHLGEPAGVEDVPGRLHERATALRQPHAVGVAFEEFGSEFFLEPADRAAERRLGHVQPLRRATEMQFLRHRQERLHLLDLHPSIIAPAGA